MYQNSFGNILYMGEVFLQVEHTILTEYLSIVCSGLSHMTLSLVLLSSFHLSPS